MINLTDIIWDFPRKAAVASTSKLSSAKFNRLSPTIGEKEPKGILFTRGLKLEPNIDYLKVCSELFNFPTYYLLPWSQQFSIRTEINPCVVIRMALKYWNSLQIIGLILAIIFFTVTLNKYTVWKNYLSNLWKNAFNLLL